MIPWPVLWLDLVAHIVRNLRTEPGAVDVHDLRGSRSAEKVELSILDVEGSRVGLGVARSVLRLCADHDAVQSSLEGNVLNCGTSADGNETKGLKVLDLSVGLGESRSRHGGSGSEEGGGELHLEDYVVGWWFVRELILKCIKMLGWRVADADDGWTVEMSSVLIADHSP